MASTSSIAEALASKWNLLIKEQLPGGHCSEVWAVARGGERLVLKLPLPHSDERTALPTLRQFQLFGGVRVLDSDSASGAVLLSHVLPGTPLSASPEEEALEVCARAILRLREAPMPQVPHLTTWTDRIRVDGRTLVDAAAKVKNDLLASGCEETLLHADLHPENILRGPSGWVVIDPKGLIGDKSFEITAFMRNPLGEELTPDRQSERLRRFAKMLGDPIHRLWGWSLCEAVLHFLESEDAGEDDSRGWRRAETLWRLRDQII